MKRKGFSIMKTCGSTKFKVGQTVYYVQPMTSKEHPFYIKGETPIICEKAVIISFGKNGMGTYAIFKNELGRSYIRYTDRLFANEQDCLNEVKTGRY